MKPSQKVQESAILIKKGEQRQNSNCEKIPPRWQNKFERISYFAFIQQEKWQCLISTEIFHLQRMYTATFINAICFVFIENSSGGAIHTHQLFALIHRRLTFVVINFIEWSEFLTSPQDHKNGNGLNLENNICSITQAFFH